MLSHKSDEMDPLSLILRVAFVEKPLTLLYTKFMIVAMNSSFIVMLICIK